MVQTGLARLLLDPTAWLGRQRVGLVAHAASVTADLTSALDACLAHPDLDLRAVFGPQHGLTTHTQDNMIEWSGGRDGRTGLPVHSLYGAVRKPTPEMLDGLDTVVVDLQDVGTRVYTYIWTLAHVMEACAELGCRVVVLDRPNPIGGLAVEGPLLAPGFESFIGLYPLPLRHGLTIGEVAVLLRDRYHLNVELEVVWMQGWRRHQWFEATGLPWVLPSPNLPTLDGATVYPGAVLVEGTQLSEGRGTTRPFELLGAPGLDGYGLAADLAALDLPGVRFRPLTFEPTFQKHAGLVCGGVQVHVTDRDRFLPTLTFAALFTTLHARQPGRLKWLDPPYEYVWDRLPIDLLAGSPDLRAGVEDGRGVGDWLAAWRPGLHQFAADRDAVLHYR